MSREKLIELLKSAFDAGQCYTEYHECCSTVYAPNFTEWLNKALPPDELGKVLGNKPDDYGSMKLINASLVMTRLLLGTIQTLDALRFQATPPVSDGMKHIAEEIKTRMRDLGMNPDVTTPRFE